MLVLYWIRFCVYMCQVITASRDAIVMEVGELLHPFIIVKIVIVVSTRNGQLFHPAISLWKYKTLYGHRNIPTPNYTDNALLNSKLRVHKTMLIRVISTLFISIGVNFFISMTVDITEITVLAMKKVNSLRTMFDGIFIKVA